LATRTVSPGPTATATRADRPRPVEGPTTARGSQTDSGVASCTDSRRGLGKIGMARDWTLVARETSSRLAPVAISLTPGPARDNAGPSLAKLSALATRTRGCRPCPLDHAFPAG
jgi:hypothetical protein